MKVIKRFKKFLVGFLLFSLNFLSVVSIPAFAQEITPEVTPEPTQIIETTIVPAEAPTIEILPSPEVRRGTEGEVLVTPTPAPIWQTSVDSGFITTNPVAEGQTYAYPDNNNVKITFAKVTQPGYLRIKQVILTSNQIQKTNALSNTAYDITSDMPNGTFTYDLTLPNPKPSENASVKYTQDGENFTKVEAQEQNNVVIIKNLDHFTLFVVTSDTDFNSGVTNNVTVNLGSVTNALGSETSDQTQTTGTVGRNFDNTNYLAQTFTSTQSGLLTKVTLALDRNNSSNTNGNVSVDIRSTSSNAPTTTVLATTSRPATDLNQNGSSNLDFTYSSPAAVTSGTTYAIVIYRSGSGTITANYSWYSGNASSDQYASGSRYTSSDSGSTWTQANSGKGDLKFTQYYEAYSGTGTVASGVLDTSSTSTTYSQISWTESTPSGTDILFEARSSNTPFLKTDTSLPWTSLGTLNSPIVLSVNGQYFQWRATLTGSSNTTPTLNDVTITYNRPPTVTLASPNGGEVYAGGSNHNITWTASDLDNDTLSIDLAYSTDGSMYTSIITGLTNSSSYTWTVPNLDSSTVTIRATVSDGTTTISDASDANFTIDTTSPTGFWISPTDGGTVSGSTVTLSVSTNDSLSGVAAVQYYYKAASDTVYSTLSSTTWDTTGLTLGTYNLRAVVTDNAGNLTNVDETVYVAAVITSTTHYTIDTNNIYVSWTTDRLTDGRIVYGTSSTAINLTLANYGYLSTTGTVDTNYSTTHTVTIGGLSPNTPYFFRAVSAGTPIVISSEMANATFSVTGGTGSGFGNGSGSSSTSSPSTSTTTTSGQEAAVQSGQVQGASTEVAEEVTPSVTPTPIPEVKGANTTAFNWWSLLIPGSLLVLLLGGILLLGKKKD